MRTRAELQAEIDRLNKAAKDQARTDASFVAEIRNSLNRDHGISMDEDDKAMTLLRDWESELMKKAGFPNRPSMRAWHCAHVGAYNW